MSMGSYDAGPPSDYNEEGVLATELSSLSELRLIRAATSSTATDLHTPTATAIPTETTTTSVTETTAVQGAPAGDSSAAATEGDQLSAQQTTANAVPNVGAWAELSNQIARRKAELASKAGGKAANGVKGDDSGAVVTERKVVKVTGMQTPGAARPRGGVRASAMGPMLAFLRSSGGLDGSAP